MVQLGNIRFADGEHRDFYLAMQDTSGSRSGANHRALFYTIGICRLTRLRHKDLYDVGNDRICPDGLYRGWQTGDTARLTRMAFNLWNGFAEEDGELRSSPYYLFDCAFAPWFWEAVRLRYPEYAGIGAEGGCRYTGEEEIGCPNKTVFPTVWIGP